MQTALSLAERTDRVGGERLRFTSFQAKRVESPDDGLLYCGDSCRIEVAFECYEAGLDRLRFGIVFKDRSTGKALVEFNTYYSNEEELRCGRGGGTVVFTVAKFPLSPGEYTVGLISTCDLEVLDWVKEAGSLTLCEGTFYPTGRMPLANDVMFHYDYTAHLETSR
jgi:hypothetical protein